MKRIWFLLGLLAIPIFIMAAAPTNNSHSRTVTSATVDSQWTGTWQVIDTIILIKDDTANTYYHFSAIATLKPGQTLYYGIKDGTSSTVPNDTNFVSVPESEGASRTFKIGSSYIDSLLSQTDANDTIKVVMSCRGSAPSERRIAVTSVRLTGTIVNRD